MSEMPADPFGPNTDLWVAFKIQHDEAMEAGFNAAEATYLVGEALKVILAAAQRNAE